MKHIYLLLPVSLLLAACGDSPSGHGDHSTESAVESVTVPANPVSVVDGVTVIEMTANDQMKYNVESFSVPSGSPVKLTLSNRGKMPKAAMGHNVVFLALDSDAGKFATTAASARDRDYIPANLEEQIIAHTRLLGPGESDTIEFTAPAAPGEYEFLCSFPAHLYAGMRGVMTVE